MRDLRSALSFLTILPFGGHESGEVGSLGRRWFPAVGLLLGAGAWAAFWLASTVATPQLGAVAAIVVLAGLTGALHLDGLADTADSLFAGRTSERRLEIMRDPRVGSFGVVAVGMVLLGDFGAISGISSVRSLAALLAAPALARFALVCTVLWLPYVRAAGLGTAVKAGRPLPDLAVAAVGAALPLWLDWRHSVLAAALVGLATLAVGLVARARIGGATGDIYGAVVEVGQLVALAGFAVKL